MGLGAKRALFRVCTKSRIVAARPDIGAIYFGDWHVNVQHEELHGANWTEWQLPIHATPRYPGHLQPNLPLAAPGFGLNQSEDDPQVMAHKIDAVTANGIAHIYTRHTSPYA